jgi:hypothetical protein
MSRQRLLPLALFVAWVFAGSFLVLADHCHEGDHDTSHCAVCSVAFSFIALDSLPVEMAVTPGPLLAVHRTTEHLPNSGSAVSNSIRAPPLYSI